MNIGICASALKPITLDYIKPLAEFLLKNGMNIFIDPDHKQDFPYPTIEKNTPLDIILSIGGDGTLLYYRNKYSDQPNLAFTGVNVGTLGFMADIRIEEFENYLGCLIHNQYEIEERLMIEATDPSKTKHTAVNDFVFHRGGIKSMITLKIHIDGQYFNTFRADGLIVATPTGSTAYSLSAGGPIMSPTISALAITPICPHALTTRPFIVPGSSKIEIEYVDHSDPIHIAVDGIQTYPLSPGEKVTICKAKDAFRLISFPEENNFFGTLREKLHWSGTSIN